MTDWWRSWHGAPTDPKWLVIAQKADSRPTTVTAVAWALFDHASQQEERGSVETFDAETYAVWAMIDEQEVTRIIATMTAKGMICDGRLTAWAKRQPKREDDSTARVRAHRASVTASEKRTVTHGNADETQRNAPDTETEGDTEQSADVDTPRVSTEPTSTQRSLGRVATRQRAPDELFEAVATACYGGYKTMTPTERSRVNKATAELRSVNATPAEVAAFAVAYRARAPNFDLTPQTMTKSWSSFRAAQQNGLVSEAHLQRRAAADAEYERLLAEAGVAVVQPKPYDPRPG